MHKPDYSWRADVREANAVGRSVGWRAAIWIVVAILFVGAIGVGIWYFGVATSGAKGAGDATKQQNSAANRLNAQKQYADLYEGILAADKNIDVLDATAKADPTVVNKTNLTGAQNICNENVAAYNAMATNVLTAQWRPANLPERVGEDLTTDCKPALVTPTP